MTDVSKKDAEATLNDIYHAFIFVVAMMAICLTVIGCHLLVSRYCKGRGSTEQVVNPRRVDREYSQGSQRNTTQSVTVTDDFSGHQLSTIRRQRDRLRSDRSAEAYKLELHPDSQEQQQPSLEEDDDYEYEDEEEHSNGEEEGEEEEDDSSEHEDGESKSKFDESALREN